jgi:hypothetical protein
MAERLTFQKEVGDLGEGFLVFGLVEGELLVQFGGGELREDGFEIKEVGVTFEIVRKR